jgi:hypothetical protein
MDIIIIIILALDIEVMMMNLVLVSIDIKHHPPAPVVAAVIEAAIAQWTLMISEMVGEIGAVVKQEEEVMDTTIALIIQATMSIMHRNALDRVVLTLVTHPLPVVMTIVTRNVIENAITLLTSANAGAHPTLAVKMFNKIMMDSIDPDARRALVKIDSRTQVMSDVHLDLSMEMRCSEMLLIL